MPTRPFSAAIIGGLWPTTSPDVWSDVGDGLLQKASSLDGNAATIRQLADGLPAENSGKTIDAMHEMCLRQGIAVVKQADIYHSMARAVNEIARVIYSARSKLDEIDANANAEIERIRQQFGHLGSYVIAMQMINEVIAKARAQAVAESGKDAAEITSLAAGIGSALSTGPMPSAPPFDPTQFQPLGAGGPGPGLHGFLGNLPQSGGPGGSPLPHRPSASDAFGPPQQAPA